MEGEFIEVAGPTRLAHTWHPGGQPAAASTVAYRVEPTPAGSLITLRHEGLRARDTCRATCIGWETSLTRLADLLSR